MTASTTPRTASIRQRPGPQPQDALAQRRTWWAAAAVFLGGTFVLSWGAWGLLLALGGDPTSSVGMTVLWIAGGFGPPVGAVAAAGWAGGRGEVRLLWRRLRRWRVAPGWYGLLVVPLAVAVAAVALLGWPAQPDASLAASATMAVPMLLAMTLVGGGLEELGWRGWLLPVVQRRVTPLAAAVAIGLVWAVWHLPLYGMVETTQADSSFGWFTLQAVALSIVLTWMHNGTGRSILLPVLFHGAVNGFYSLVVDHVEVAEFGRFETTAAALMTGVALLVVAVAGPRLGLGHGVSPDAPTGSGTGPDVEGSGGGGRHGGR